MLVGMIFSDNGIARNMENFWQYAKVYEHQVDSNQNPLPEYFEHKLGAFLNALALSQA